MYLELTGLLACGLHIIICSDNCTLDKGISILMLFQKLFQNFPLFLYCFFPFRVFALAVGLRLKASTVPILSEASVIGLHITAW